jgi:hypothetical protein
VTQQNLLQNRDYQVLNNYRDIYSGLLARIWDLKGSQLQAIFPQAKPRDLQLV